MTELEIKIINYLNINNPSNHLPYHSIDHLFTVFNFVKKTINTEVKYEQELIVAALFHDYNHSGGKLTDSENISNAILGVNDFFTSELSYFASKLPDFNLPYVKFLIQCTEFPYTIPEEQLTLEAKMLRDADMSYMFEDLSIVKLYSGLRAEFGNSLIDFLNNQKAFLSNIKFYMPETDAMWNESFRETRLNELDMMIANV